MKISIGLIFLFSFQLAWAQKTDCLQVLGQAEDEFNAMFRNKQAPGDVEERVLASGAWKLPKLLVELQLAPSMAEARRLIEQGGVSVDGERRTQTDFEMNLSADHAFLIQVGKRRFVRVGGRETHG